MDGHPSPAAASRRHVGLIAVIGALFLGGLGIGALIAGRGEGDAFAAPAGRDSDPALTVVSADRFRSAPLQRPVQTTPVEVEGSRVTPTVTAARAVGPSVVSVRTLSRVRAPVSVFDELLGRRSGTRTLPGLGSGFAIDEQGHILTNHHVVRDADEIEIIDQKGQRAKAELVGSDELTDLAVIRVPPGTIPSAPLGTSFDLIVGEPATAIGNPSGFQLANTEATVTAGVVSGVGRDIVSEGQEVLYADMIQTDAAINPGNSGGPLVNAEGEVIGVNSSIFSRSGGSEGLAFAIPIDRALRIAAELIEFGRVRRPWVGVDIVTEASDSLFRVPIIEAVAEDSPGARAGLRPGDEIVSLNGRPIRHGLDWNVALVDIGVGHTVEVEYRRRRQLRTATLVLEEIPSARAERVEVLKGLQLITVTPQIQQERGLAIEFGALIVDISDEVSRITRLRRGDVIWGINGNEVRDVDEAAEFFDYYARSRETQGWVQVHVARGRRTGTLRFRVG